MRISDKRGVVTVDLTKAETRVLCEARYLTKRLGQILGGEAGGKVSATAESLERLAKTFGGKYVDSDGNLLLSDAEKARYGVEDASGEGG